MDFSNQTNMPLRQFASGGNNNGRLGALGCWTRIRPQLLLRPETTNLPNHLDFGYYGVFGF